jgi:hypothetical protein
MKPILAALLLALPVAAQSAGNTGLDDLMTLLAQRRHGEADFREEKSLSVLRQPLISTGILIYDAPDHLEQRTLTPRPQSLVLDHGVLSMRIGTRSRTMRLADNPQLAPLIDSIRATLAGDRAALERVFEVSFDGDLGHWSLHLTPRDSALVGSLARIDLEGAREQVQEIRVQQKDGDHSLMHIVARE